jgi:AcrR family transcriptional regulator
LYYHFTTKEDLFLYVIEKGVKMLIDSVAGVMEDSNLSADERMVRVLDEHLRFFSDHRELCLLLLSFFTGDEQRDRMIGKLLAGYFSAMEKYMFEWQQAGRISPDIDVQTLASALFGMTGFTVIRKQFRNEPLNIEESQRTLRHLLRGVMGQ